ncbi:hypothetical protein ALP45_01627 [Pseudomonas coronafaciens pv. atropurpurea]|nr:Unknown protein sequence [Pseudomonas coronafaciens pv. atropurpurea]RMT56248.1 hypothetical protein ALP45_01627 [Pseudomonas coronafaciens pv. atropurpurea]
MNSKPFRESVNIVGFAPVGAEENRLIRSLWLRLLFENKQEHHFSKKPHIVFFVIYFI